MTNNTNDYDDFPASHFSELTDQLLAAALFTENRALSGIKREVYASLIEKVYQEITLKVNDLTVRTASYPHSRPVINMLLEKLMSFARRKTNRYQTDYFKTVAYQLELAHKLEKIDWDNHDIIGFTPVDEVLVYMNYNSKSYIKMLEGWLAKRIESESNPLEQLEKKNFYQKAFSQLQRKPDTVLYSDYTGLTEVMDKWFQHETEFLSNRLQLYITAKENKLEVNSIGESNDPILWDLSADQIGLLLRAADDTRIILSRSMNAVFKTLVPHIKTKHSNKLSASAVRSRSYNAEQTDKDIVIGALEKMISRIRDY